MKHPNSSFHSTILPEHVYLATNPGGQHYVSTSSLDTCKTFATRRSVCRNLVVYDSEARPTCEIQILFSNSKQIPETCTTSTFPAEVQTFQTLDFNKWLYVLDRQISCILQCHNQLSNFKLQGAGVLTLPQGCKLHTGYSTLAAYQEAEENVTIPIVIPDIRTDDCYEKTQSMDTPRLIPITINETPLDSLRSIQHHLDRYSEELKRMRKATESQSFVQRNHSSFMWVYISIAFLIVTYFVIKLCNGCPNTRRRRTTHGGGCIRIFNNCFDYSSRRRSTQVAIPMRGIHPQTSSISEDEDEDNIRIRPPSSNSQRSGANTQSLF